METEFQNCSALASLLWAITRDTHPWRSSGVGSAELELLRCCEETAIVTLFNLWSSETKLFPPTFYCYLWTTICCLFSFSRNPFTKSLVTTSKMENHSYRRALAICVEKPFLRQRQTWLILVNTVIMRGSIMLEFLLFVGAFTSVCQWISHL